MNGSIDWKSAAAFTVKDARRGLKQKSIAQVQESLNLFFDLLDFQAVSLGMLEQDLQVFARPKVNGGDGLALSISSFWTKKACR